MTSIIGSVTSGLKTMFKDDNKRAVSAALMAGTLLCPGFGTALAVGGFALGASKLFEADKVLKDENSTAQEKLDAQEDSMEAILAMTTSTGISATGGGLTILGISSILNMYDNDSVDSEILSTLEDETQKAQEA